MKLLTILQKKMKNEKENRKKGTMKRGATYEKKKKVK